MSTYDHFVRLLADMPRGLGAIKNLQNNLLKVQNVAGVAATFNEKRANLLNFADPPVTLVATLGLHTYKNVKMASISNANDKADEHMKT